MRRRKRMMEDLDQDIRDHIEMETQDNIERGMPPEEARYAALRKFGSVTRGGVLRGLSTSCRTFALAPGRCEKIGDLRSSRYLRLPWALARTRPCSA
jgi:hypothetical protein